MKIKFIKLFAYIPLYFLYYISGFIPRNNNKICFGGAANSKYYFLHFHYPSIRTIWIAKNEQEFHFFKSLSKDVYKKWSVKGVYHAITSGKYVTTHSLDDINKWICRGVKYINIFHGVGVKPFGFDLPYNQKKGISLIIDKIKRPVFYYPVSLLLVTTPFIRDLFKKAFRVTDDVLVSSMLPRNMFLLQEKTKIIEQLKHYHDYDSIEFIHRLHGYSRIYIYMPTWRDSNVNFLESSRIDFNQLNQSLLESNSLFILKLHPNTNVEIDLSLFKNIILCNNNIDVYPILPFTDVLITDYSSVYFDYILMNKDIILFTFDLDDFIKTSRDLAIDIRTQPAIHCNSADDLYKIIANSVNDLSDKRTMKELIWGNNENLNELDKKIIDL